jgi:hypothetical protein
MGNSSATGKLYMVKCYTWDGVYADESDVFPTLDNSLALLHLVVIKTMDEDLEWFNDVELFKRGPGRYDYTKYYITEMQLDEEL